MQRRDFLHTTLMTGAAIGTGVLTPQLVLANEETAKVAEKTSPFEAKSVEDTLKALDVTAEESEEVKIKAQEIAENGAVVPLTVSSTLEGVTAIHILVSNNPTPLAASFKLGEGAIAKAATRVKMGKTSDVIALVQAGDKTYMAKKEVKVTIGGCGG